MIDLAPNLYASTLLSATRVYKFAAKSDVIANILSPKNFNGKPSDQG